MPARSFFVAALALLLLVTSAPAAYTAPPSPGLHLLRSSSDDLMLEVVVPEPSRKSLSPLRNGPERFELEGYATGPDGLPIRQVLIGLPPEGAIKIETEPLAPVRLIEGPVPAIPAPRFVDGQERTATPPDWEWQLLDDQARKLPLASIVEEGFFRGWRVARLRLSPLAYVGDSRWELTPRVRVRIVYNASARTAKGSNTTAFGGLVEGMLLNGVEAVGWQTADPPVLPVTPGTLPATTWRIGITADGIYRLTHDAMKDAGVPVAGADPADFHLWYRGQEVALQEIGMIDGHFGPGDAFLFYGEKFYGTVQEEKYTDENVYWLSVDTTAPGLRMQTESVAPGGPAPAADWYRATVRAEENSRRWARWSTEPGTEATWFFWDTMAQPKTYNWPVTLDSLAPGTYTATVQAEVASMNEHAANPDHHLDLDVNGTHVGNDIWDGKIGRTISLPVPSSALKEGLNQVGMTPSDDAGEQMIRVNWVEITYRRQNVAQNDRLDFSAPFDGKAAYTLSGFSTNAGLRLYDLSNPFAPRALTDAVPQAAGSTWDLVFTTSNGTAGQPYMAVADAQIPNFLALTEYHPDLDLLSSTRGADEIMIVPDEFFAAIQPLANHRRAEGLRVEVAAVKDVYALFNDGIVHPEAIRRFLAYAYQHWEKPAPAYALLVGDGHYNPKGYNPAKYGEPTPVYIPPYLEFADPWEGEVPVDTAFARIVGDDRLPDMAVGRLPANSAQEVADVVAKIIAYEKQTAPASKDRVIFTADNIPDQGGDFEQVLDDLSTSFVPPDFRREKVYLTDFCGPPVSPPVSCPSATEALLQTWSEGAALLTYSGHGAVYRWTHERMLVNTDVARLSPGHDLPFVITLNCLDGYWMMPPNLVSSYDATSMAEWMVMGTDHGSIANFSPAGLGTTASEEMIARRMYDAMFFGGERRLGELALTGQLTPVSFPPHIPLVSTLLGDPGGRLSMEDTDLRFAVDPNNSALSAAVGGQAVHSFTLTNQGDFQDGAELSVVGNKWPATPSPAKVTKLGPSETVKVQVTVNVPAFVTPWERDVAQLVVTSTAAPNVQASARLATTAIDATKQAIYLPLVIRNSGRP